MEGQNVKTGNCNLSWATISVAVEVTPALNLMSIVTKEIEKTE